MCVIYLSDIKKSCVGLSLHQCGDNYPLGLGLFISTFASLKRLLLVWACVVFLLYLYKFSASFSFNPYTVSTLATKEHITEMTLKDKHKNDLVFVYDPAIYTFDYDYLFRRHSEKVARQPSEIQNSTQHIYLIVPSAKDSVRDDFVNYVTPNDRYKTLSIWKIADGTFVFKRAAK